MSGKVRRYEDAPRPSTPENADASAGLERTAELIAAALRQQSLDDTAEQAAVTAFRDARILDGRSPRTRRSDDWRPKTPRQRWVRGGAAALVTSALLGGIAFASIREVDTPPQDTAVPGTSHSTHQPPSHPPSRRSSPASEPTATPTAAEQLPGTPKTAAQPPGTPKSLKAHCRAYERIKNRGHALDATAWQRLVQAAGTEQQVAAYCHRLTGSADESTPSPTQRDKTRKGHGKPTARAKPSKGPADRN
ncbi:hypothetical protein ACFQMH_20270 [Streptomyces viridiviolaceus]|uniref:Uncharacterized protein n=1 Tax=Streptomyces viridiviolaceus TaxID=68282 RepID=A0ABW2E1N3_9ACTN|nr:hypothetical protein [Streptomyces viridiviolaceus]